METMADPGTEQSPQNRAQATCRYCGGDLYDATPESGYTGEGPDWAAWGTIAGTVAGFDWGCDGDGNPDVSYDEAAECWDCGSHEPDDDGINWPETPWGPNSLPLEERQWDFTFRVVAEGYTREEAEETARRLVAESVVGVDGCEEVDA